MIPFVDLQAQYRAIGDELQRAVTRVLASGHYVLGPEVDAFEQAFASAVKAHHAVGVNSGTSALHLALLALGAGPGDEVIAPALTFGATVAAIEYAGATPVLVDVEEGSRCLDTRAVQAAITPRTRVIIPVHLHGQPADMDPILALARDRGLHVLEDAAQAHGARYEGRPVGGLGDAAAFSFYPAKNLGAAGEAGLLATSESAYSESARAMRDWGQTGRHEHRLPGFNYRMDALQGAILSVKLRYLEDWVERRRTIAAGYRKAMGGLEIECPAEYPNRDHAYHVFAIRSPRRDALRQHLTQAGVGTGIHYPQPIHLQANMRHLGYEKGAFPVAERLAAELLSLPVYPELSDEQQGVVIQAIRSFHC